MSIIFTSLLLWMVSCSRIVKGQSECQRTNRQPGRMCVAQCDPSTGCSETEEECLCDGDCGYSCVKKDLSCGIPPNVRNAKAQYPSTKFGETVTYVCNKGYTLSGASQRTCRANENWDGVGPNCLRMCTLPTIPFSTYIKKPDNFNRTYMTGERITLACKKGFKEQPGGNPIRICINGLWTRFPFECEGTHACKRTIRAARTKCTQECSPESGCGSGRYRCQCDGSCGFSCVEKGMSCGNPPPVQNGKLNFTGTGYNATAHYSCNEGYDLNTDPIKRCTAKKRWDGLTPRCLQDCPEPTIPRNANISNPSKKYRSGYKVTFKCNKGYNQEGMATQMCFLGGWTVLPFKCTEGGCGDPGTPENGRKFGVTYSVNSMVYFNCDLGYELAGSPERKCQLNGTWTGTQPVCEVVNCGFPPRPKNGSFVGNETTFQSSLQFRCDDGFDLEGSESRMCTSDKNWSGKEVSCIPVDCGRLPAPLNGSLSGEKTTYPNHVEINCDQGFILSGSHKRTCQADGRWDGNKTSCKAVDCGALTSPTNGSSSGTATTFSNIIKFSCDVGFDLVGSSSRVCMANETWSGEMPVCKAVDCGKLAAPMNGTLLGKDTTYLNEVEINCDEGFILRGPRLRKCQADRRWSGDTTVCEAIDCGKPKPLQNGSIIGEKTEYPNVVYHRCDEGFVLQGPSKIKCQTNGTWSTTPRFCEAVDCGPLSVPINGSSFGDSTVFPNNVLFQCDPGFNLNGSSTRMCQANATWSGLAVICVAKDCGPLAVPTNGSSTGDLTVFPNRILFSCDEGFLLRGSDIRHCQANGGWSGNQTFCEAVDCGPLPVPINGSSSGDSTVFPNNVLFNCDHGFILSGSTMRTCQPNGTWSGLPSLCSAVECGPLSVPMNGSSSGDSTVFPNSVVFSCDPGFILNGSKTRTCWGNGTWSGTQAMCSAVDCGQPHPLKNGSIIGENTVYPNFVTHQCDEGFILRGSSKIKCQANGTWSRTSSFCEAKDCGILPVPLNGSLTGSETTFPNEVTFSCDDGFILNGSSVRRCLSDGSWSGIQTSCEAVDCGPLYAPMNGSAFGDSTVFPNSVQFKCDPGFLLTGSSKRTCQPNGTWNGLKTMCVARDCGPLAVPTNGSSTGDLTFFPNKIDFNCDEGFILRGSHIRQCQANGAWSGNQTYCEAVDCGPLSVLMNGSSSGDLTVFPNSVHFTCNPGFILNGSSMRTCQPDGTWNGRTTICVAVDCGALPVPKNGSSSGDSTVFPNNVRFKCDPGFILNGSTIRTCQPDRTWSGFPTICSAVDCGRPQPLQNGSIIGDKTVYPNYVNHACDEGFILRGSPEIKCQTNGTWSRTSSFCEAKDCGPLTAPLNGSIAGRETTFPSKVTLSCDEGFLLNGTNVKRCQANGNWSGTETSCKAVDCGPLPIPPNGTLFGELTVFPNEVKFSCDPGYILSGSYTRKCRANGTWTGMETICTPVDCGPLQPLQNGSLIGESTVFPDVVYAACHPGFILRGSSRIDCQVNGSWSSTDTFCEAKDCGNLLTPRNGSVIGYETTYPNELEFKCDVGFELRGSASRRCEADGKWGGVEANCQAVDCGPLNVPENGVAHGNSTTYPSVMSVSCKTGFSLQGTATRKCQADGTWTSGKVVCLGQDCGLLRPPHNGWIFGSKTTHPHSMIFSCEVGFTLDGSSERTCLRNGSWSGQQPKCLPNWCSKAPDVPAFAYQTWKASKTRYQSGQSIYYSCKGGFIMVGIPVRQCNMGQWSELRFNCSAPSCNAPKVPKYSYVTSARGSQSKYLHGEKVYYSCRAGYKLVGIPQIECTDGVWTKNSFSCEAVNCGSLTSPSNGWIQKKTGETFGALHLFKCNVAEGYLMKGSKERRCLANATWSGVQPVCYLQTCDVPRKPVHGKLASKPSKKYFFGNVVEYQCNNGFSPRGHDTTRCQIHGNWSNPAPTCLSCSSPLGLKNRMIFSHQLSASSERDSRHGAKHGRLHGNSAWCSARSSFPKYFQIDFGRTMQVTAVATQGHPREQKWVLKYVVKYLLGKNWLTYQESGQDKVFRGNRDGNTVMKHYLKEKLVAKTLRILRHQNSKDFMGSTVCLRAEVYGCEFQTDCLTIGSEVFARWNSVKQHTSYFHGFITKVRETSVEVSPSGEHGAKVDEIVERPRAKQFYVIIDKKSKPAEIKLGSEVIVASKDNFGSQGKVTQKFVTWYGVQLGNGEKVWSKAHDIRLLRTPVYCDRE